MLTVHLLEETTFVTTPLERRIAIEAVGFDFMAYWSTYISTTRICLEYA